MNQRDKRDPWMHAVAAEREYLTPEDLGAAIRAGASRFAVYEAALEAIQMKRAEDVNLCAYVAVHGSEWRKRQRGASSKRAGPT